MILILHILVREIHRIQNVRKQTPRPNQWFLHSHSWKFCIILRYWSQLINLFQRSSSMNENILLGMTTPFNISWKLNTLISKNMKIHITLLLRWVSGMRKTLVIVTYNNYRINVENDIITDSKVFWSYIRSTLETSIMPSNISHTNTKFPDPQSAVYGFADF